MADSYGDVFLLRFGTRNAVVVSSLSAAEECFTKNDVVFANRSQSLAGKHLNYNHKTIGFSNYNDHWRSLRRLTSLELLSATRLSTFTGIRHEEIKLTVKQLLEEHNSSNYELSHNYTKWTRVKLRPKIVDLVFNIMMKMIAGKRYYGNEVVAEEAKQFQSIIREASELLGSANINDFLPFLQWIDFQGVEKRMIKCMKKMDSFFQSLVDEHKKIITARAETGANDDERNVTFIELILSLQKPNPEAYDDETIKGLILAMLFAGTDTTILTIEWAMSLLLNHPNAMHNAWAEIEGNVGHDRLLNESDLPNLHYLQSVINETFRLFPSIPIIPRESSDDCTVSGFFIPKGTMMFVNTWTIQRDEKLWENATSFLPERFGEHGAQGINKLLMFGGGRRICPGALSARRVVSLALGSLIQTFEWKRIGAEVVDLAEEGGLHMLKVEPLEALCKPQLTMLHTLNQL
ncbi:Isoflavone 2'-hydroxylase [Morus notabilis]|uniref:Isoflavone 2'-hydroxylase n=1 Tax=Morus notabilis TaxID=981085 RepID=W9QT31_9ROSA|nr:cytochrome P450 81E8 [Morus notabilis]EXB53789.1 Isoflavone 2'-hydroxylase [Morus notabilis]